MKLKSGTAKYDEARKQAIELAKKGVAPVEIRRRTNLKRNQVAGILHRATDEIAKARKENSGQSPQLHTEAEAPKPVPKQKVRRRRRKTEVASPPTQPVQSKPQLGLRASPAPELPKAPVLRVHENPELIRLSPVDKMLKERMRQLPPPDVGEFHRNPAKDLAYGVWLSETLLLMEKLGAKPIHN